MPAGLPHTLDLVVPERAPLTEIAQSLFEHPGNRDGTINSWWWRQGALGVLVRRRTGEDAVSASGAMLLDVAVLLDNRPATVSAPGFRDDWETWLEVSNTLMFRPPELVTVITVLAGEPATSEPAPAVAPRRVEVSDRWREVLHDVVLVGAEELAQELSRRDVPAPEWVGEEVGADNIPVDLGWPGERVVVLLSPNEQDERDLAAEGWRIVAPDADAIAAALEEAR